MAIYHLSAQVISRGEGRSAVACAAYRACERIADERTGRVADYRRKGGHVAAGIELPEGAPEWMADRALLWNAAEAAERGARAQVAREVEFALPRELPREAQEALARRFARTFAETGMVADWSIHDPDGANVNPHCHMMLTMRPISPDGSGFGPKAAKEYLCRRAGEGDRWMTSAQLGAAGEGWAKVYRYGGAGELTKAEAEAAGLDPVRDRASKAPVDRKRDLTGGWNDKSNVEKWRLTWENMANDALAEAGRAERIDRRSFERRHMPERVEPTRHEGPAVTAMERRAEREARAAGRAYEPVTELRAENAERRRARVLYAVAVAAERARLRPLSDALAALGARLERAAEAREGREAVAAARERFEALAADADALLEASWGEPSAEWRGMVAEAAEAYRAGGAALAKARPLDLWSPSEAAISDLSGFSASAALALEDGGNAAERAARALRMGMRELSAAPTNAEAARWASAVRLARGVIEEAGAVTVEVVNEVSRLVGDGPWASDTVRLLAAGDLGPGWALAASDAALAASDAALAPVLDPDAPYMPPEPERPPEVVLGASSAYPAPRAASLADEAARRARAEARAAAEARERAARDAEAARRARRERGERDAALAERLVRRAARNGTTVAEERARYERGLARARAKRAAEARARAAQAAPQAPKRKPQQRNDAPRQRPPQQSRQR